MIALLFTEYEVAQGMQNMGIPCYVIFSKQSGYYIGKFYVNKSSCLLQFSLFKCMLLDIRWTASSEFGTYRLCEQRRFRRACASAQSRQNLRCSLIQAVSQEEPSDRKLDLAPLNGWACTVKICHDGMLEDTNSLDAVQILIKCKKQ